MSHDKLREFLIFLGVVFLLSSMSLSFPLTILHTNDLHSHFEGTGPDAYFTANVGDQDPVCGHYARIVSLVNQIRNQKKSQGEPVLLLDAGDFFGGSLFHFLGSREEILDVPEFDFFQTLKYDGYTLGNHEFDAGEEGLKTMLTKAQRLFGLGGLVSTNLSSKDEFFKKVPQQKLVQVRYKNQNIQIGLLGANGPDGARVSTSIRSLVQFVGFDDVKQKTEIQKLRVHLEKAALQLRQQGADLVVLLFHGGNPEDRELAESDQFDVIIAGHTHEAYPKPFQVGKTWVNQAGSYGKYLGNLEFYYTKDRLSLRNLGNTLIKIDDRTAASSQMLSKIKNYKSQLQPLLKPHGLSYQKKVVEIEEDKIQRYEPFNPFGTEICSRLRRSLSRVMKKTVDVYFTSIALVREDMKTVKKQSTTYQFSDMFRILPTGISKMYKPYFLISTFYLTGKDLKKLMSVTELYRKISENFTVVHSDSLTYQIRRWGIPFVNKLHSFKLNDKTFNNDSLIHVATNSFVASFFKKIPAMTYGLIKITMRDAKGNPISDPFYPNVAAEPVLLSQDFVLNKSK